MNVTEFGGNRSLSAVAATADLAVRDIVSYVVLALGVPGNALSAIVWLRRHVSSKNRLAVYLAALAINDLVCLLFDGVYVNVLRCFDFDYGNLLCRRRMLYTSADVLDLLLVLSLSVVRLVAIRRPSLVRASRRPSWIVWPGGVVVKGRFPA